MAVTAFGVNDAQTVKLWSKKLMVETLPNTLFSKFLGKGEDSILQTLDELKNTAGDTIKYDLLMKMSGAGVTGDRLLSPAMLWNVCLN